MAEHKRHRRGCFDAAQSDRNGKNIALFALVALKTIAEKQ
jgi:hypothetical protein